jgi:hypothetical protein
MGSEGEVKEGEDIEEQAGDGEEEGTAVVLSSGWTISQSRSMCECIRPGSGYKEGVGREGEGEGRREKGEGRGRAMKNEE